MPGIVTNIPIFLGLSIFSMISVVEKIFDLNFDISIAEFSEERQ